MASTPPATSAAGAQLYATLLLNDNYLPGALVLAHSLRDAGTTRELAVLVTLDSVSADTVTQLKAVYHHIIPVPRIRNDASANLHLMKRADLHSAFTKINLWKQTQFSKIVYIDADVVAYRAPDELFDLPHAFSAAPDIGWPDIFNTGVMVLAPNLADYYAMLAMAERGISFDGADQGLINMHFQHNVHRLPFTYNVTPSAHYQYVPAYRHFQSSISMVHFIGANKPWYSGREVTNANAPFDEMVGRWWAVHDRHYTSQESPSESAPGHLGHDHEVGDSHHRSNYITDASSSSVGDPRGENPSDSERPDEIASQNTEQTASFGEPTLSRDHQETRRGTSPSNQHQPPVISMSSWDPQRQPPPTDSKPEAINFPSAHYEMSSDTKPFVPPARYPSPPKNMWYDVPKAPPASADKPRHVFPWESKQPAPSRSFIDPAPEKPRESPGSEETSEQQDSSTSNTAQSELSGQQSPVAGAAAGTASPLQVAVDSASHGDTWDSYSRANAWDQVPGIGRYVEGLQRHRRGKSKSKSTAATATTTTTGILAVSLAEGGKLQMPRAVRVTDFPTEVERPSLPVTPAPIRRPSVWGGDKEDSNAAHGSSRSFPVADGVPLQSEWDPAAQLQKLAQQQSEALLRKLSGDGGRPGVRLSHDIPARPLPFGSESLQSPTYVAQSAPSTVLSPKPVSGRAPVIHLVGGLTGSDESSSAASVKTESSGDTVI